MPRKPKGKPLKLWPVRVDEDVKAECLRLGKEYGTINEGLREVLLTATPSPKGPLLKPSEK